MSDITTFRTKVQNLTGITISDRGGSAAAIDEYIRSAVEQFSYAAPLIAQATVTVTGGTRSFATTGLTRPLRVLSVEYPTGAWPPTMLDFQPAGTTVYLDHSPPSTNYNVAVTYEQAHLVDTLGSTIPAAYEQAVSLGAAGLAFVNRSGGTAQVAEGGTVVTYTYQWLRLGQEYLSQFRAVLESLRRIPRQRQLYGGGSGRVQRSTVQWPE